MFMAFSPRKKLLLGAAAVAVLIGAGVGAWRYANWSSAPAFPINGSDRISSWTFKGAYADNDVLIAQANADIEKLKTLLAARACAEGEATSTMESGSTECNAYDPYDLYLGIGNDYNLLGNGRAAYENYAKAAAIHEDKGLAYANFGHLFDELGAYRTAADAYAKATAAEPGQIVFHTERLKFLTLRFPDDTAAINEALEDSEAQFGAIAQVLAIKASWQEAQGKYAEAIATWEEAIRISPGRDTSAMEAQIARDRAKL
jgi:tetratricopeptide (TPR) repeat protein